jgi:hydroxyacylglutathione hydrolase
MNFLEKTLVVGPFQCNCRILACPKTGQAAVIDPGDQAPAILAALRGLRTPDGRPIEVRYLLQTHGHLDHIGASRPVKESLCTTGTPQIALHRADEELYLKLKVQGSLFGMEDLFEEPLPIDHYLEDDESLRIGELKLTVAHTPGHSPGSVCLRLHEDTALGVKESLYSGDTLFQGSVGRTDLWGGDQDRMFRSIRERLLVLDDDTRVCPGHGPETSIGVEKRENPFL